MNLSKNLSLIIAITIPILAIIFIAVSIYLPRALENPKYNFLYITDNDYYQYRVESNKLIYNNSLYPQDSQPLKPAKLYVYNFSNNQSTDISLEEAQNLYLDSSSISSDGFQIIPGNRGGFFSGSSDFNTLYIQGHSAARKLNFPSNSSFGNRFSFLGWIIE